MAIEIRAFNGAGDIQAISHIYGIAFGRAAGESYARRLAGVSAADRKDYRCLTVDSRVASFLDINPRLTYVGRSLLKVAGIGGVCTDPAFRDKGLSRSLFKDTVRFLEDEGYDLSILYGIPDYYHKYGFEVVMPRDHAVSVARVELPNDKMKLTPSAIGKADLAALCRLYNRQARYRDGNCRRSRLRKPGRGLKLTDSKDRLVAYASWRNEVGTLAVHEAVAASGGAARELLLALRRLAWREGLEHLKVLLPFGYPLTDAMRGLNCTYTRINTRGKGCMGRVLNMDSLVRKMRPEWARLAGRSEFSTKAFEYRLEVGDRVLKLSSGQTGLDAVSAGNGADGRATPERFVQMLLGYRSVAELAEDKDVSCGKRDLRLLEVLFPERDCLILGPDRF